MELERFSWTMQAPSSPIYIDYVRADDGAAESHSSPRARAWIAVLRAGNNGFQVIPLSDESGNLERVVVFYTDKDDLMTLGDLSGRVPAGHVYAFREVPYPLYDLQWVWALGAYRFQRYKKSKSPRALLWVPDPKAAPIALVQATYHARDLINTPAQDMTPEDLYEAACELKSYGAEVTHIVGDALLGEGYPCVHAVGRGSVHAPQLIEIRWGKKTDPLCALIGKGVCFDSGGYDLKNPSNMLLMRKDMGGAAHVLGLAQWIMQEQWPIQLRILIPAVENLVSGSAYKPGDVLTSRKGLTIEIGDTDAEGRLVMADALTAACEESPRWLLDFSTLTGAARVAVGTEIAAYFCNQDSMAQSLEQASREQRDAIWRLPLHAGYRKLLDSTFADLNNSGTTSYAAAITAALFLQEFITRETPWVHFDMMAWNVRAMPGRPEGGEAMGLRAAAAFLKRELEHL